MYGVQWSLALTSHVHPTFAMVKVECQALVLGSSIRARLAVI